MKGSKGFSLIELLIVVAVIGIIAAIAVPNLVQSKKAANEASAISSVRSLATAQITYSSTVGAGEFANDLNTLLNAGLIDDVLGSGTKDGYTFETHGEAGGGGYGFTVNADPETEGITGDRHFYINDTGVIRYAMGMQAGLGNTPLGQ